MIAWEAHRPQDMPDERLVFHRVQALVYRRLMQGENVILSAPTSFGKSLIIDAVIASDNYDNIVVVVPTLALLDETRRRLAQFRHNHKIITHTAQALGERNIFVLTQERVIERPSFPPIDFFVIDEFYKLSAQADPERGALLNQAFYRLWKTGAQFYFLGPNVESLPSEGLPPTFSYTLIATDFSTVALDVIMVHASSDERREAVVDLCYRLEEPTLVYCRSPARTREVVEWLLEGGLDVGSEKTRPAVDWIGENFHPAWLVPKALERGIGIHHGRLPRSLAQYMVRAFNEGDVQFLVCTSTLIEGVNTTAKNVVIFDSQIARQQLDYFTFNNIQGRSGRMFRHFVGQVFLFHEPPLEQLPLVDIPALTQPDSAPDSLLVQIEPEDLSETSKQRLEPFLEQDLLPVSLLKENTGVSLEGQLEVARLLDSEPGRWHGVLGWHGMPNWDELVATTELMWDHLFGSNPRGAGAFSARQLAYRISQLRSTASVTGMIRATLAQERESDPNEVIETSLDFIRHWAGHQYPRGLAALDRIQAKVFRRRELPPGDYSMFAAQVENVFQPASLVVLDEFGIPIQVALKLAPWLVPETDLDLVLGRLGALDVGATPLSRFEQGLVQDAQRTLI